MSAETTTPAPSVDAQIKAATTCPTCKGSGRDLFDDDYRCPTCLGNSAGVARPSTPHPSHQSGETPRLFPGLVDHDREVVAGSVIRKAVEHDNFAGRFYLTCSVGEVAQRVVVALLEMDAAKPAPSSVPAREETADSDARMLLVWEAWAKNEGNAGAAALFRRVHDRLHSGEVRR